MPTYYDDDDDNDFVLTLEENAMDSLVHAVEHFIAGKKETDLKYTILHVFHAVELFLKARLAKADPNQIYEKPDNSGANAYTVKFDELIKRLGKFNVDLSRQDKNNLQFLRQVRNSIEHHRLNANSEQIEDYVGRAMRFLETFLENELGITLKAELNKEVYHILSEALYSYEERLKKAEQEMEKHLPQHPRDRVLYEVLFCQDCDEKTVAFPDETSKDGTVHCFFCERRFYGGFCGRCGCAIVSATASEDDDGIVICDNCCDQIADYDD